MRSSPIQAPLAYAQAEVAEIFGQIAAFWGFTRTQGRIYGLLFLAPEPLTQSDIRARLEISAGSASMTLASLERWGVLRRVERSYEAETDLWRVITSVLRRRERDQVISAIERIEQVVHVLTAIEGPSPAETFALYRANELLRFFRLGRRFLDALVAQHPVQGLLSTIARRAAMLHPRAHFPEEDVHRH